MPSSGARRAVGSWFSMLVPLVLLHPLSCVHLEAPPGSANELRDAVIVVGDGEARGQPDIARLQLGVEARATTAKQAIESANRKMAAMIQAIKQLGVDSKDLQTSGFNIHSEMYDPRLTEGEDEHLEQMPEVDPRLTNEDAPRKGGAAAPAPDRPRPTEAKRQIVYRVSNMLHITLRDLNRLGEVLSQAVNAGANQAWGVSFDLEDPKPLKDEARAKAVAEAKRQATELARLSGVRLGRIISIADEPGAGPMPTHMALSARDEAYQARAVPVEAGQLTVQSRVRVVFAIEAEQSQ